MSMLTLFELQFGVERADQSYRAKNLAAIAQLTSKVDVLPFDEKAAMAAAKVRQDLLKRGQGIGPYDVLIAGHALSRSLVVVTSHVGEFTRVDGLRVEDWTA
jgi:tRNA(fMet)-specific endonuclease VapC